MQSRSFLSHTSVLVMNPGFSISSSLHQSEPQKATLDSQINKGTNFPSHKDRRFVPRFSHHRSANKIIVFHKTRCYLALNNKWFTRSSHHLEYGGMAIPSPNLSGRQREKIIFSQNSRFTFPRNVALMVKVQDNGNEYEHNLQGGTPPNHLPARSRKYKRKNANLNNRGRS